MCNKISLPIVFLIFVALLSACAPSGTNSEAMLRTLSVNGSAKVVLTPDVAYISVGVHSENEDANQAVSDNNAKAQQIMDALSAQGIDPLDIQTSNFSIYPSQKYDENGNQTGVTFMVDNTVTVTLRDLAKVGETLSAAVSAGANNIYGIQFDLLDKTAALSNARQVAVADARKQADELAQAAGVAIGEVQSINFYNAYPTPVMDGKGGVAMYETAVSVPVSPGQMTIQVDVNIVYTIQ